MTWGTHLAAVGYAGFFEITVVDADAADGAEATAAVAAEGNMAWPASLANFMSERVMGQRDDLGRDTDQMERTFGSCRKL